MFLAGSGYTMYIILGVVVLIVLIFIIVSSISSKKAQAKEQEKRKKVVKDEIKTYLGKEKGMKNIRVEYEKVYARKGVEYKYRDVFDVIVQILEPKTNKICDEKAFEIEGITKKINKKNYQTSWKVNGEIDLKETREKIAIVEKKIKLTPEEKKALRIEEKNNLIKHREKLKEDYKKAKTTSKQKPDENMQKLIKKSAKKFVPIRSK